MTDPDIQATAEDILRGLKTPTFPPGYGYPSLKDWEMKRQDEERFQRFWNFVRRSVAMLKG